MSIKIISAGAGSGKTYRLTNELVNVLQSGAVRASGIIATTFTKKAAAELQERVRAQLLASGMVEAANELSDALIGTVHSVGVKLLKRFAFEAGISPDVDIMADADQQTMFNQSLATVLTTDVMERADHLCQRLGLNKKTFGGDFDWRKIIKDLTEVARSNDFSTAVMEQSKQLSFQTFQQFLSPPHAFLSGKEMNQQLAALLKSTIRDIEQSNDETKATTDFKIFYQSALHELELHGALDWHQWAKISKPSVGAKSKKTVEEVTLFAANFDEHPDFQTDIRDFIFLIFEASKAALIEFEQYKKRRGLIDYTDMETLVKQLLRQPEVSKILASELDLLLVDEFQDTSPLQLDLFLSLSGLVAQSIWVGDPKQSIYGFRGAEPALMQAVIEHAGGIKSEDILSDSWRSRPDLVHLANAIFVKAFPTMPAQQIALHAKRTDADQHAKAFIHWHFECTEIARKTPPATPWGERSLAHSLHNFLQKEIYVTDKATKEIKLIQARDIVILCRTNKDCQMLAEALHHAGIKANISRSGLMETKEAKIVLACMRFLLNRYDSLSIAEILLLAADVPLKEVVESRLDYLEQQAQTTEKQPHRWADEHAVIQKLHALRRQTIELSATETFLLLLEDLDIRQLAATWGQAEQRLDNLEQLGKYAIDYENNCTRLHGAASLGGLLLWFNRLANRKEDLQAADESADALQVVTYHRSKGLEWAVVVCWNLDSALRDDVWGMTLVETHEHIDLGDLLGGRWLRYWVNPLADQLSKTRLQERIAASDAQREKQQQAVAEDARLLYVGLTRARDYLILPTRSTSPKWLNRVFSQGNEAAETLDAQQNETPFEWNNTFQTKQTEIFDFPKDIEAHAADWAEKVWWIKN